MTRCMRAKATYYYTGTSQSPNSYDHKVLAEATLYGLPTWVITTGATFADEEPVPRRHLHAHAARRLLRLGHHRHAELRAAARLAPSTR